MKKANYLFSLLAIGFAVLVLFISLQSANSSELIGKTNLLASKFYVTKEILPDHSLYPLLMVFDRVRLELADSEKRTYLLVSYSQRRFFYSRKLLEKGNKTLAFTTLSKALKYLNQAMEENIIFFEKQSNRSNLENQTLAFLILENFDEQMDFIVEQRDQFNNEEKVVLESLCLQSSSLAEKLRKLVQ
ncbi:MAG TPA: DUF5667 domain-containing protein [Candidatus Woesebacteria bacterium]|nr:DUF5667 domain-containing protein [Candidatus Woesebacteria bacterium]